MQRTPVASIRYLASLKYLLILYLFAFVLLFSLFSNAQSVSNCSLEFSGRTILVNEGRFERCLDEIADILKGELRARGRLDHQLIVFVMDKLSFEDKTLKNAMM